MLKILIRLYLVTLTAYGIALYAIPEVVLKVFETPNYVYNLDQARGPMKLIQNRFDETPQAQWAALESQLQESFAPLQVRLVSSQDETLSPLEKQNLANGIISVRSGFYGTLQAAIAPLPNDHAVELFMLEPPVDINLMYWLINILIGAVMLVFLLAWLAPHWRDLERLRRVASQLGEGDLTARTLISPRSNISALAQVFDRMAHDVESLIGQQQELLNAVSHELRTPLSRLEFGFALVLADDLPSDSKTRIEQMVKHVRELDELINELLSYTRLQSPGQDINHILVELEPFVDSILGGYRAEQAQKGYEVILELEAPSAFALDPRLTARALENLISNAVRHCAGRVLLRVSQNQNFDLVMSVEDDGEGIPLQDRGKVLEPFYRGDSSRTRETGGFGLGLAISKRAITSQGGTLRIEESRWSGACLKITLPRSRSTPS